MNIDLPTPVPEYRTRLTGNDMLNIVMVSSCKRVILDVVGLRIAVPLGPSDVRYGHVQIHHQSPCRSNQFRSLEGLFGNPLLDLKVDTALAMFPSPLQAYWPY